MSLSVLDEAMFHGTVFASDLYKRIYDNIGSTQKKEGGSARQASSSYYYYTCALRSRGRGGAVRGSMPLMNFLHRSRSFAISIRWLMLWWSGTLS